MVAIVVLDIGIGAESTWGHDIFARKYKYEKLTKSPNLRDICPKIRFPPDFFWGEGANAPMPPSHTPMIPDIIKMASA